MEKLVSLLVAVYNTSEFLSRCLDSLLMQTYKNIEIIIVDDGSTDNSLAICKDYEKRDERIIVIHKENGGLATARNEALVRMQGEYFCFIDSDDFIELDYVEKMVNALDRNENVDVAVCGYYKEVSSTKTIVESMGADRIYSREEALANVFMYNSFAALSWNKMFKKHFYEKYNIKFDVELRMTQDLLWTTQYFQKIKESMYIAQPLYHYMYNESSACRNIKKTRTFNKKFLTSLLAHEKTKNLIEEENQYVRDSFIGRYVNTYLRLILNLSYANYPEQKLLTEAHKIIKKNYKTYLKLPAYGWKQKMGVFLATIHPKLFAVVYNLIDKIVVVEA